MNDVGLTAGFVIRAGGSTVHLTAEEAGTLADAANERFNAKVHDNEFFSGVAVADAIETAWAESSAAEFVAEGPEVEALLELLTDDLVGSAAGLGTLRDALRRQTL